LEASVAREESYPSSLGHLYADLGRLDIAEDLFMESVRLGEAAALVELGSVYQEAGDLAAAERVLRQALDQNVEEAPEYLAAVLAAQDKRHEAVSVLESAVTAGSPAAHCALADMLSNSYDAEDLSDRIESLYLRAIQLGDPDARHNYAIWLLDVGRHAEGENELNKAASAGDALSVEVMRLRDIDKR
jgi:TPR repeat protein